MSGWFHARTNIRIHSNRTHSDWPPQNSSAILDTASVQPEVPRQREMVVGDSSVTRPSLLLRVRDNQDTQAWTRFIEIYSPLIHRFAIKRGLQDADAADLTQDVLRKVSHSIRSLEYDPKLGRFRSWLFKVAHNQLNDHLRKNIRQPQGSGDTAMYDVLANQAADSSDEELWNQQYQQRLFHWAAEQAKTDFQETTWQAFWKTAVDNESAKSVAEDLGITSGAVYIAKSRVLARLKEIIQEVDDE